MSEKYLDFTGLSRYDSKIKEVIQKDLASIWAASTAYTVGQYVVYKGLLYQCKTDHTSGSTFDATKWDQVKVTDLINAVKTTVSTAVQTVNGTSPVSASKAGTTVTVSLENSYGDTKNPYASKTANYVLAAPNGSAGSPSFRKLVAADIPDLSGTYIPKSVVTAAGDLIVGSGSGAVTKLAKGANGKFLTVVNGSLAWGDTPSASNGKLTINGATSSDKIEFTADQSTDTSGTINKAFVGLGSVVNTGDSATPTQNGTDKFTTGGAYALKTALEEEIRTQSAHFRGEFSDWSSVPTTSDGYLVDDTGSKVPTVNDYIVVTDASDYSTQNPLEGTWRFVYTGVWSTNGKSGWNPQYKIETPTTPTLDSLKNLVATNPGVIQLSGTTASVVTSAIKTVSVSGNTLTLTPFSGTATTFTPTLADTNQKIKAGSVTFGANDVIDIVAGSNVTVTGTTTGDGAPKITISSSYTDTNYYPTAFSWTGGTTAGPTGSLTGSGMSAVSFGAIPSASASASGIVTTGDQTFAGVKTFSQIKINTNNGIAFVDGTTYKTALLIGSGDRPQYKKTTGTAVDLALKSDIPSSFSITVTDDILDGTGGSNSVKYAPYSSKGAGHLYTGDTNPSSTNRLNYDGYFYATKLYSGGSEVLTSHQTIPVTDVQINGTSIVSNKIANFLTNTAYNSSSNLIATMLDIPSISLTSVPSGTGTTAKTITTWGLDSQEVVFESITQAEIDSLFTSN